MPFSWEDLLVWGLGIIGTGFAVWLTAFLSFRSSVRQKVWQTVFEKKWQAVTEFAKALDDFSLLMVWMANVSRISKIQDEQFFVQAYGLLTSHWRDAESRPESVEFVLNRMGDPRQLGRSSVEDQTKRREVLVGVRNLFYQELQSAYRQVADGCSQLVLVGYDPQVAKDVQLFAMETLNKVGGSDLSYTDFAFEAFFAEWISRARLAKLRLREDLNVSAKSLAKALALNPTWRKSVLSGSIDE